MATFQLPAAPDVTFDAAEVSSDLSGNPAPVVTGKVAYKVLAATGRKFAWVKGNLVVQLDGPGNVIEVLRPRHDGLFDLGEATWVTGNGTPRVKAGGKATTRKAAASG